MRTTDLIMWGIFTTLCTWLTIESFVQALYFITGIATIATIFGINQFVTAIEEEGET